MFYKKIVFRNFKKFTRRHLRQSLCNFIKKETTKNCVVLDPDSLNDNWLKKRDDKEEDGILQWPSTDYLDISNFIGLTQILNCKAIGKR